jgi:hypothetical protein
MSDPRSHQAELLVRGLAALPGSTAVNVVARKFPRLGPAEAGTGYQQDERRFACNALPDAIVMPGGMDEITITLQGVMADRDAVQAVRAQVSRLLSIPEVVDGWDSRARFAANDDRYQVTVFTETFPGIS